MLFLTSPPFGRLVKRPPEAGRHFRWPHHYFLKTFGGFGRSCTPAAIRPRYYIGAALQLPLNREKKRLTSNKEIKQPSSTGIKTQNKVKDKKELGMGMAMGIAIGAAIGVALDNLGVWIAIGVALGAGIGSALSKRKKE